MADGIQIGEVTAFSKDALDSAIGPYCANLSQDNEGTWGAFARSSGTEGHVCRLEISDVLAAGEPDAGTSALAAGFSELGKHGDSRQPAGTVWVLQYDDGHGEELSVHVSYEHGLSVLAKIVRSRWDNITSHFKVPATCDDLTDDRAVELYFAHRAGIECYWLLQEDVEGISPVSGLGDPPSDPAAGV